MEGSGLCEEMEEGKLVDVAVVAAVDPSEGLTGLIEPEPPSVVPPKPKKSNWRSKKKQRGFTFVQPPVEPLVGKPTRFTNQLQYIEMLVMKALMDHPQAFPFEAPVNTSIASDYYDVIEDPMDFGTIKKRLQNKFYWGAQQCMEDFELVFRNCRTYNRPGEPVLTMANELEELYRKRIADVFKKYPEELEIGDGGVGKRSARIRKRVCLSSDEDDEDEFPSVKARRGSRRSLSISSDSLDKDYGTPIKKPRHQKQQAEKEMRSQKDPMKGCMEIVDELYSKEHYPYAYIFYEPVDPIELCIPMYFQIIKNPMDMRTIQKKLIRNEYNSPSEFDDDFHLMFRNCAQFNVRDSYIMKCALDAKNAYLKLYNRLKKSFKPGEFEFEKSSIHNQSGRSFSREVIKKETTAVVKKQFSPEERTKLQLDFQNLSSEDKGKAIQIFKKNEEAPVLYSGENSAAQINFLSLKPETINALKTLIHSCKQNKGLKEQKSQESVRLKEDGKARKSEKMRKREKKGSDDEDFLVDRMSDDSSIYSLPPTDEESEPDRWIIVSGSDAENVERKRKKKSKDAMRKKNSSAVAEIQKKKATEVSSIKTLPKKEAKEGSIQEERPPPPKISLSKTADQKNWKIASAPVPTVVSTTEIPATTAAATAAALVKIPSIRIPLDLREHLKSVNVPSAVLLVPVPAKEIEIEKSLSTKPAASTSASCSQKQSQNTKSALDNQFQRLKQTMEQRKRDKEKRDMLAQQAKEKEMTLQREQEKGREKEMTATTAPAHRQHKQDQDKQRRRPWNPLQPQPQQEREREAAYATSIPVDNIVGRPHVREREPIVRIPRDGGGGTCTDASVSIVSQIRVGSRTPTDLELKTEARKRELQRMKEEAQRKRYREARQGPMYHYLTSMGMVNEFEDNIRNSNPYF